MKPWGTAHAILCCKDVVDGPFAVINADDYYGKSAFQSIYDQLVAYSDNEKYQYTMVGYKLYNTLTENGHVARGVCTTDENSRLVDIHERTRIEKHGDIAEFTEDDGAFLPFVVDELLKEGKADVTVLKSIDRWYGVTYKEDKETVVNAIKGLKEAGFYPEKLWEEA